MNDQPRVTVVVPAYRHERYITECLESVLAQTYPNLQVLVYDDGSPDATRERIEAVAAAHPGRFTFVPKENEGLCATLNRALRDADGDYVALIASDDVWLPEHIGRQVELMERHPEVGLSFSDVYFLRGETRTTERYSDYKPSIRRHFARRPDHEATYRALLAENLVIASTTLTRRSVLDEVGPFDPALTYEDYDMWLRIARRHEIAYVDEPLGYYRTHATNISNDTALMLRGALQALRKQYRTGPLRGRPLAIAASFARFALTVARNRAVRLIRSRRAS